MLLHCWGMGGSGLGATCLIVVERHRSSVAETREGAREVSSIGAGREADLCEVIELHERRHHRCG